MRQEGRQRTITREETKKRRNREKLPKQPENNNMAIIIICSIITFTGSDEIHQSKPRGWPNILKKKKKGQNYYGDYKNISSDLDTCTD